MNINPLLNWKLYASDVKNASDANIEHGQIEIADDQRNVPIRVLQIGEGHFIRAFVDWMLHVCQQQHIFNGGVVVTQPREKGASKLLKLQQQDGLFTLVLRGIQNGKVTENAQVITSISQTLDPYKNWQPFLSLADQRDLEFIFSNTTEAGITYEKIPMNFNQPIHSFPGKLTVLLFKRYKSIPDNGWIIFPCELLEKAGDSLRKIVLQHADDWQLDEGFKRWVTEENVFVNSLVDRIVTGHPQEEIDHYEQVLGYTDPLLTVAEPYHQWLIEANDHIADRLPFHKAGLNVLWVDDLQPYVQRKVRILNGAHTFLVPIAFLQGYDIVRDAVNDKQLETKIRIFLEEVVAETLDLDHQELLGFIEQTLERFRNPYIDHRLLDISMNSCTKFCTRLVPTLRDYVHQFKQVPDVMAESIAYMIIFHRIYKQDNAWHGYRKIVDDVQHITYEQYVVQDDESNLQAFATHWANFDKDGDHERLVELVLRDDVIWVDTLDQGHSAPYFGLICSRVSEHIRRIHDA